MDQEIYKSIRDWIEISRTNLDRIEKAVITYEHYGYENKDNSAIKVADIAIHYGLNTLLENAEILKEKLEKLESK